MENECLVIVTNEVQKYEKYGIPGNEHTEPHYRRYIVSETSSLEELPVHEIAGQKFVSLKQHDNLMIPLSNISKVFCASRKSAQYKYF